MSTDNDLLAALPTVRLRQRYRPRQAHFLELCQTRGWLVKLYGLAYDGDRPANAKLVAAKHALTTELPQPARSDDRYGIAVAIVHQGQDSCWLLIDWWGHESILHHRLLMAPLDEDEPFRASPPDITACVWELPLLTFERDAWVAYILDSDVPDVSRYLECRFNGPI